MALSAEIPPLKARPPPHEAPGELDYEYKRFGFLVNHKPRQTTLTVINFAISGNRGNLTYYRAAEFSRFPDQSFSS